MGFTWSARLDSPTGTVIASGNTTLTVPLGSRVDPDRLVHRAGQRLSRVYLVLSTSKSGQHHVQRRGRVLHPGHASGTNVDDAASAVTYTGTWGHASGETGPYAGTNSYSDVTGDTATLTSSAPASRCAP